MLDTAGSVAPEEEGSEDSCRLVLLGVLDEEEEKEEAREEEEDEEDATWLRGGGEDRRLCRSPAEGSSR